MELITPNFIVGRSGKKPIAIVLHSTEGSPHSSYNWCKNPNSAVSYHEIIDYDGQVLPLVDAENTAWHCGSVRGPTWKLIDLTRNPNTYTIGIAFGGWAAIGPTAEQVYSLARRVWYYCRRYGIPLDREHIIGHYEIRSDKTCPGPKLNIAALIQKARTFK